MNLNEALNNLIENGFSIGIDSEKFLNNLANMLKPLLKDKLNFEHKTMSYKSLNLPSNSFNDSCPVLDIVDPVRIEINKTAEYKLSPIMYEIFIYNDICYVTLPGTRCLPYQFKLNDNTLTEIKNFIISNLKERRTDF